MCAPGSDWQGRASAYDQGWPEREGGREGGLVGLVPSKGCPAVSVFA